MLLRISTLAVVVAGIMVTHWCHQDIAFGATPSSKVKIDGKAVLANIDKHSASIRVGKIQRDIKPKKASVLSPKSFPISIEVWSGAKTGASWQRQSLASAGVYLFRFQNGQWTLSKKESQPSSSTPPAAAPQRQTVPGATSQQRASSTRFDRPTYRRATGSVPRVVRGGRRPYYGPRIPLLGRVAGNLMWIYRFVRDEEDRDLIRDIIIGEEIDKELEDALWDRLDDMAVNLPAYDRREFERSLTELQDLSDSDLRDLEAASDADWDQARDYLGDQVTDNAWDEVETDFSDIDVDDAAADVGLEEVGIDSLESDIDIADLDGGDVDFSGDIGGATLDDVGIGDLAGGIEDIDVGDLGADFAGANEFGDIGAQVPNTIDNGFQGGDMDAGSFDAGDLDQGFGDGGFQYDGGGFDDFGGGFDGGGEFDDGGGFDDFGGGFDDF